jgi:hypothetical protein
MQNRIDRLEGLVLSLMTSGAPSATTAVAQAAIAASRSESFSSASEHVSEHTPIDMITEEGEGEESEVENLSHGIGVMKMDGAKAIFASEAHWYAILCEISEVKKYFDCHKEDFKQRMATYEQAQVRDDSDGPAFLLQSLPPKEKSELLAAYPPKVDADRLIARYFNAYDPSVHIIHGPSFQKQYHKHWLNPSESSVVWLGLNFSMMTLALQSYSRAADEPPEYRGRCLHLSHEYRKLTAQCLQLADITQPIAQMLETLVLYMQAEYGRSKDCDPGVLLLTSICVRLAMRMGYHRDPAPHPAITPFQGEIRRRVWTFIRGFDSLISFQFGLPAMIKSDHMDTESPRNLYDDELFEDMKALPPSRPVAEATPMSYMITKSKMTYLFGRIVERSQSLTNPVSYEETMKADHELRETRAQHPPLLQARPFVESARDPANLIMQRIGLEMMFLRCLFVLHRKFIMRGRENSKYAYSRRTCLDASLELLSHQATLHAESQPGGRLRSVKWYISSLTTHDFLLAAMLICSDLHHTAVEERNGRKPGAAASVPDLYDPGKREEMLRAVEHCIVIWDSVRDSSMEAYKGAHALRIMVERIRPINQAASAPNELNGPAHINNIINNPQANGNNNNPLLPNLYSTPMSNYAPGISPTGLKIDDLAPEQSAAMTLGLLSSGGMPPGPSFVMNNNNNNNGGGGSNNNNSTAPNATGSNESRSPYPLGMAGLLNDSVMPERTGLTPGYSGDVNGGGGGGGGPLSPMSQLLAQSSSSGMGIGGLMGTDGLGTDIDWVSFLTFFSLSLRISIPWSSHSFAQPPTPPFFSFDLSSLTFLSSQKTTERLGFLHHREWHRRRHHR